MNKKLIREMRFMMERLESPRMTDTELRSRRKSINEGFGTALLVLTGVGILYLGRKLKTFIDKYGKYLSSVQLGAFLSKIQSIEDGKEEGKVIVKQMERYTYLAIVIGGEVFDSLTIDMENDSIYSGHKKEPKQSDLILPRVLPRDADTKDIEEIKEAEEILVGEILSIITKYGKNENKL
jgi:hypothetical protein